MCGTGLCIYFVSSSNRTSRFQLIVIKSFLLWFKTRYTWNVCSSFKASRILSTRIRRNIINYTAFNLLFIPNQYASYLAVMNDCYTGCVLDTHIWRITFCWRRNSLLSVPIVRYLWQCNIYLSTVHILTLSVSNILTLHHCMTCSRM